MGSIPIAGDGALLVAGDQSIADKVRARAGLFQLAGPDRSQPPVNRLQQIAAGIRLAEKEYALAVRRPDRVIRREKIRTHLPSLAPACRNHVNLELAVSGRRDAGGTHPVGDPEAI